MFEHLDDDLDVTPAPLERVLRRGRALRTRRRVLVGTTAAAGVAMIATAGGALASTDSTSNHVTTAAPQTAPSTAATRVEPATTAPTVITAPPTTAATPQTLPANKNAPGTGTLRPGNPQTPSTVATPADITATATPMHTTVSAGTTVHVTLHLTNHGGTAGSYIYAWDGCPIFVVPTPGMCSQQVQSVTVPAHQSLDYAVSVNTTGAASGHTYSVRFQTLSITITIS